MSRLHLCSIMIMILSLQLAGCAPQENENPTGRLQVVATTTIVADVVAQVGGENIDLSVLLPVGADPHSFDPTPQDIAGVAEADLVFASGAGLEAFLDALMESAGAEEKIVQVSEGVDLRQLDGGAAAEEHAEEAEADEEHDHEGVDPHTWTDPNNVMVWVENIARVLSEQDPENAESYAANAEVYTAELEALDDWIREQVALVPVIDRQLVTDHTVLGYFAEEYGFVQVGALISGYSTMAAPTAKDLAEMEDAIRDLSVKAVFVGNTINPALAERVAEDTGVQLVYFYTGSLTKAGAEADTYLKYMRYNVDVIVEALTDGS